MTQKGAADAAGVPVSTLQKWEQGVNEPDVEMIVRLARLYGTTTDELLGSQPTGSPAVVARAAGGGPPALAPDERELVDLYRRCTQDRKAGLLQSASDAAFASEHSNM